MCPASITRGAAAPLSVAKELPLTSATTWSAKLSASARQARAGTVSYEEGPGESSSVFRNCSERGSMGRRVRVGESAGESASLARKVQHGRPGDHNHSFDGSQVVEETWAETD